jgi:hypothetical protein
MAAAQLLGLKQPDVSYSCAAAFAVFHGPIDPNAERVGSRREIVVKRKSSSKRKASLKVIGMRAYQEFGGCMRIANSDDSRACHVLMRTLLLESAPVRPLAPNAEGLGVGGSLADFAQPQVMRVSEQSGEHQRYADLPWKMASG